MEQIKLNDINFHSLQKLKHQGTKATLYRDGNVCFKILDGLYDDEKELLYKKLLDMDGIRINNVLLPQKLIVKEDLSVRDVESLVKKSKKAPKVVKQQKRNKFFSEVELALVENLGRKVKIKEAKQDAGVLEIEFFDKDDLEDLAMKLENYGK